MGNLRTPMFSEKRGGGGAPCKDPGYKVGGGTQASGGGLHIGTIVKLLQRVAVIRYMPVLPS